MCFPFWNNKPFSVLVPRKLKCNLGQKTESWERQNKLRNVSINKGLAVQLTEVTTHSGKKTLPNLSLMKPEIELASILHVLSMFAKFNQIGEGEGLPTF
jgi:hypothetical protein